MGAEHAIDSDICELIRPRRASVSDAYTLAMAAATGVSLVEAAAAQLGKEILALHATHPAREPLSRLVDIADVWLRDVSSAVQQERPAGPLGSMSAPVLDAVDEWYRTDGRLVYRTMATRWPWPAARRLIDALVAADEIITITTRVFVDEYIRHAANPR